MLKVSKNSLFFVGIIFVLTVWISYAKSVITTSIFPKEFILEDTSKKERVKSKKPIFEPHDREGDPYANPVPETPFVLPTPSNVTMDVELDSTMENFIIQERIGDMEYRPASTMTFEEYQQYKNKQMMQEYWKNKSAGDKVVEDNTIGEASLKLPAPGLGSIFGKDFVEIKPNGYVNLDFGGRWQRVNNPSIPVRQQRMGGFEFDQQIGMNVVGMIGDKLRLTVNWDTKAHFEFQNNLKLEFTGYPEDIIQKIEAGNVTMPINSQLISGSQNLFGIKTQLQFGRLSVTSVASSQRGKAEEIRIEGGSQSRNFEVRADNYDENRHFFIGHFFRNNYERSLANPPVIMSGVKITRMQVFITNRTNNTNNTRNMVAYLDLGEGLPYKDTLKIGNPNRLTPASNDANRLYSEVSSYKRAVSLSDNLTGAPLNLEKGSEFEIINNARRLEPNKEFNYHEDLGYISLNSPLRTDEVLAVAYEYTYNGKRYQVGQLQDETQVLADDEVMILKLLKPSTIKLDLPTWDLMMKNIYLLGSTQLSRDNFQLRVLYKDDISGADRPNIQEGERASRAPLLRLLGLDRLNPNNDPPADGNFDYVEGFTVDSRFGRIIFPVLEPFGSSLQQFFDPIEETHFINKYVFQELYDMTKRDAEQIASKNKFFLKGRYQASSSSEIMLPGINISPGSVIVTAGSAPLQEGVDYTIDYNMGRLKIINEGVLASGNEIKVRFEKTDLFNFRQKYFLGSRFDYRISKDVNIGATILHQSERPQISRVSIGDEPSSNMIWGLDANYTSESRLLTKAIDKLPFVQTKAPSSITLGGEFAQLVPGRSRALNINQNEGGTSYIDDFEGSETPFDLTRVPIKWHLGATPLRFPEATFSTLQNSYKRARLAWYNVDNVFYRGGGAGKPNHITDEEMKNHFVRMVLPQEVFPNFDPMLGSINETTLDLAYYPTERGPYNYNPDLTPDGKLKSPKDNYGAITRAITSDIDFDNSNIQYIEFWMMSPYINSIKNTQIEGEPFDHNNKGQLYFNLGSISEDVIKDGRHSFENGLPVQGEGGVDTTAWGVVPRQQFLTNAFDNVGRERQDVGLDGLPNSEEAQFYTSYLNALNPSAREIVLQDPSGDDFKHYLSPDYDAAQLTVLERYKFFNGLENNSPVNTGGIPQSNSMLPDNEDLNQDNTVSDLEEYYEYKVDIDKDRMIVGQNYIVDQNIQNVDGEEVTWYLFRIPIREPDQTVGNISGFKSIRFMRMYMTGFEKPVVLRMARLQMVANQWRVYMQGGLDEPIGDIITEKGSRGFTVSTVNIEQHGQPSDDSPPYVLPPGFQRDLDATAQNNRRLNEQSLRLCIDDVPAGESRAVYKNVNMDWVNYRRLKMFVHAHSREQYAPGEVHAFIRIGTDFIENYYEISIPLHFTPISARQDFDIWLAENELDFLLEDLVDIKVNRDRLGYRFTDKYTEVRGNRIITVSGRPDMSSVQTVMLGLKNPRREDGSGIPRTACVWLNELRLTDFVNKAGWATTAQMNAKLADVANVTASLRYVTAGFGSLDQRVSERQRNNTLEYGIASNVSLDKFLPEKIGLKLPFFASHNKMIISPQYNPLDNDVPLSKSLNSVPEEKRDEYRSYVLDETTRNSWNFTNIQKVKTKPGAKSRIYDVENLALSFGMSRTTRTNIDIYDYDFRHYRGSLAYNYSFTPKVYEPFKNMGFLKSPYLRLIKDFNFSLLPSRISIRGDLDRRIIKTQYYEGNPLDGFIQDPFYEKAFGFNRTYALNWNLTKSISIDYTANAFAIIDEPDSDPDSVGYNKVLWEEIKKGGRMKDFNQMVAVNYKIPFDKIPFTDWLAADVRYSGSYKWTAGALNISDTLGHMAGNNSEKTINGRINMDKLYNKVKFLKEINSPAPKKKPNAMPNKKDTINTLPPKEYKALKAGMRSLMSMKNVTFSYSLNEGIVLPGFMPTVDYFGLSTSSNNYIEMLPFILGSQDINAIRNSAANNGWLTDSRVLNTMFAQNKVENFSARTALEPIKDLKVNLDVKRTKGSNYQSFYRVDSLDRSRYNSENPFRNGNYSSTYITIKTAFSGRRRGGEDPNSSYNFKRFEDYRHIIRAQLLARNPNATDENFGLNSQDVLIPAFLAAYSGRDPSQIKLSPLNDIPLPNWRIDYNGLTKIEKLKKIFPTFTVSHAYQCMYNVTNFSSSLLYDDEFIGPGRDIGTTMDPVFTNENDQFVPVFVIDQVTIAERFAPLIGINFRTKSKIQFKIDYTKDRTLSLNMTNSQVTELRNEGVAITLGYAKSGVKLPFPTGGNPYTLLKNELNFMMNFAIRDGITVQRKLDEPNTVTAGNLNWQLRPTVSYLITQRLTMQLYFERNVNAPAISSSFRRTTTAFGIQLRFLLS